MWDWRSETQWKRRRVLFDLYRQPSQRTIKFLSRLSSILMMCGFPFVFSSAPSTLRMLEKRFSARLVHVKFAENVYRMMLHNRTHAGKASRNRFENNQNKKHYHFTIRRTQTRCLMNHIAISSDVSPYLYCGKRRRKEEQPNGDGEWARKVILLATTRFFHFARNKQFSSSRWNHSPKIWKIW